MIPRPEMTEVLASFGVEDGRVSTPSRHRPPTGRSVTSHALRGESAHGELNLAVLRTILAQGRQAVGSGSCELVVSARDVAGLPDGITVAHEDGAFGLLSPGHHDLRPRSAVLSLLGDIETAVAEHGGHGYRLLLTTAGRQCAAMSLAADSAGLRAERCRPLATHELRPLAPVDGAGRAVLCGLLLLAAPIRPAGQEERS
ncbi:hypothetical protein [Allokutzneria oryzae]|uniref:Uncharacterized protein n=1 Tax=Allokutzneria oryzae TaxID=1378989 RepID=A0ABV5ZTJ0_9PSEU